MNTYLFDFDGTLVDSMPTYTGVMLRILREHNIPYENDLMKIITPLGYRDTAKYFVNMGVPMSAGDMIERMHEYAVYEYTHNVPAKAHVIEVLHKLRARGDELHVLTASPHATLDPCLKRLGIYDMFKNVWSCEDFGTNKADPEIYHMAAERIGRPIGEILFLDDNINADLTAKQAGMKVYGVYDDFSREFVEDMKAACDFFIYDFSELISV